MPKVLILMGSESDRERMEEALPILREGGVEAESLVCSAHREPDRTAELARAAASRGFDVIICGAGLSAALPGVVASHSRLPVIGVPLSTGTLGGLDALLATVQMPPGVPVACVGIDNAQNAAHLALRILGAGGK
ncbi:MAG: 5-(carboxyamino)imidazole ribonucleotide mutase [Gemmatimonadetes bacterium]|nr:5-(carboxyamino)imidazole ribonucleotide mutase [Gemmatimonadota bacterium]